MIVDAPNTAYALQAKKILRMNGLQDTDYTLKTVGGTLFRYRVFRYRAMREDKSHAASMLNPSFSIDAPGRRTEEPGPRGGAIGPYQATGAWVLRKRAAANADTDPKFGLARDGRLDAAGFRNVLALRAEIEGDWGGTPPPIDKFVDLSFYEAALKRLK